MKPKITKTENELMGRHRTPDYTGDAKAVVQADDAVMPSLETAELKANQGCVDSALVLIGCLQMNHDSLPRFDEADRKSALGAEGKDWRAYGDLHLAVDAGKPDDTRMHYRHAVVKDGVVYTRALKKLCFDANVDIAGAAWRLCKAAGLTVENAVARPQRAQFACPVMAAGRSCPMNAAGRCCHLSDDGACKIAGETCPLISADKLACPLMAAGEGSPMDAWSGCAQLTADAECRLQNDTHCCMCTTEEEAGEKAWSPEARAAAIAARRGHAGTRAAVNRTVSAIEKIHGRAPGLVSRQSSAAVSASARAEHADQYEPDHDKVVTAHENAVEAHETAARVHHRDPTLRSAHTQAAEAHQTHLNAVHKLTGKE